MKFLGGYIDAGYGNEDQFQKWLKDKEVDADYIRKMAKEFEEFDYITVSEQQSYEEQALTELVANAIDAYGDDVIGRFGIGALSNLQKKRGSKIKISESKRS